MILHDTIVKHTKIQYIYYRITIIFNNLLTLITALLPRVDFYIISFYII